MNRTRFTAFAILTTVALAAFGWSAFSFAATRSTTVAPGDHLTAHCQTQWLVVTTTTNAINANCKPLAATATATSVPPTATVAPTATTAPPTATMADMGAGACGESLSAWHPQVVNGCDTHHEHGDAPPAWVTSSPWPAMFDHPGNTPSENILKHTSFKGVLLHYTNTAGHHIEVYWVLHIDTTPNGQSGRYHSYQAWELDSSGGVSHWDGWMNFGEGDNTGPTIYDAAAQTGHRPVMSVFYTSGTYGSKFETWYTAGGGQGGFAWDFGITVSAQYYHGTDAAHPSDPSLSAINTWLPTGQFNTNRRIEASWYADRDSHRGTFYATQFGQIVSGPTDPICGTTATVGAKSYTVLCLQQYIAPTAETVGFPGNSIQTDRSSIGLQLPN